MNELESFYSLRPEAERLRRGIGPLELVRTRELLAGVLPDRPAVIYDVGGGTGQYAGWLTAKGHEVHLVDPLDAHVATASSEHPELASARVGDARLLPWLDESADVVLVMGPLYHLLAREDRVQALQEARRVLRKDGVLFAVIIPRWASALVGMQRGWTHEPDYSVMVTEELATGVHRRPASWPRLFMDGFFHSVADIEAECSTAGFAIDRLASIEGPAWMSADFETQWQDLEKREVILEMSRAAEGVRELLAASPHVAVVARPTV